MKIDEAIKVLKKYNYEEVTMYEPKWDAINTLVRLAEWYHSQDLIPRETAKMIVKHETGFCSPLGLETMLNSIEEHLEWIPKAEPPKERNGDCETCKHYDEPKYCNNCYVRDDEMPNAYETYIPKENEQ